MNRYEIINNELVRLHGSFLSLVQLAADEHSDSEQRSVLSTELTYIKVAISDMHKLLKCGCSMSSIQDRGGADAF